VLPPPRDRRALTAARLGDRVSADHAIWSDHEVS
jgi:hypothetical protein